MDVESCGMAEAAAEAIEQGHVWQCSWTSCHYDCTAPQD